MATKVTTEVPGSGIGPIKHNCITGTANFFCSRDLLKLFIYFKDRLL